MQRAQALGRAAVHGAHALLRAVHAVPCHVMSCHDGAGSAFFQHRALMDKVYGDPERAEYEYERQKADSRAYNAVLRATPDDAKRIMRLARVSGRAGGRAFQLYAYITVRANATASRVEAEGLSKCMSK